MEDHEIVTAEYYNNNPDPIYGYCVCDHCKAWRAAGGDEPPLPPETTTPMPPMLHIVAPRLFPKPPPPKPHITPRPSRWPEFVAKMSPPTDSVQP